MNAQQADAVAEPMPFDLVQHLRRQMDFSARTYGPGARTAGVCDHIRKELEEVQDDAAAGLPTLPEWVDVIILGFDGAWRSGATPEQIVAAIVAKQTKNEGRTWPDWRTANPNQAIEHDRSGEAANAPVPDAQAEQPAQGLAELIRAYVRLLESARDRIVSLGGACDPVDVMERSDPALRAARGRDGAQRPGPQSSPRGPRVRATGAADGCRQRRARRTAPLTAAASAVLAERRRQVEVEGWTPEHDDEHGQGEMALAAACYAGQRPPGGMCPGDWPWKAEWWKPKDRRTDLVRAAALLLAEIERLDRAAARPEGGA